MTCTNVNLHYLRMFSYQVKLFGSMVFGKKIFLYFFLCRKKVRPSPILAHSVGPFEKIVLGRLMKNKTTMSNNSKLSLLLRKPGPLFEQTLKPFSKWCSMLSLINIGPMVLHREEDANVKNFNNKTTRDNAQILIRIYSTHCTKYDSIITFIDCLLTAKSLNHSTVTVMD